MTASGRARVHSVHPLLCSQQPIGEHVATQVQGRTGKEWALDPYRRTLALAALYAVARSSPGVLVFGATCSFYLGTYYWFNHCLK